MTLARSLGDRLSVGPVLSADFIDNSLSMTSEISIIIEQPPEDQNPIVSLEFVDRALGLRYLLNNYTLENEFYVFKRNVVIDRSDASKLDFIISHGNKKVIKQIEFPGGVKTLMWPNYSKE